MKQGHFQARGLARRQAMLTAASELFLEKGFEQTTVTDIVDRAGGSRRTLYEHFGNKDGLLRSIIEEATDRIWNDIQIDVDTTGPTEADLVEIAVRLFKGVTAPDATSVYRIVVAEGHRTPEIADLFLKCGPGKVAGKLATWFEQAQKNNDFLGATPDFLAQSFMGIVLGRYHISHVLGKQPDWGEDGILHHVTQSVRTFVCGARSTPAPDQPGCQSGEIS